MMCLGQGVLGVFIYSRHVSIGEPVISYMKCDIASSQIFPFRLNDVAKRALVWFGCGEEEQASLSRQLVELLRDGRRGVIHVSSSAYRRFAPEARLSLGRWCDRGSRHFSVDCRARGEGCIAVDRCCQAPGASQITSRMGVAGLRR